jgi:hypothetical protein
MNLEENLKETVSADFQWFCWKEYKTRKRHGQREKQGGRLGDKGRLLLHSGRNRKTFFGPIGCLKYQYYVPRIKIEQFKPIQQSKAIRKVIKLCRIFLKASLNKLYYLFPLMLIMSNNALIIKGTYRDRIVDFIFFYPTIISSTFPATSNPAFLPVS